MIFVLFFTALRHCIFTAMDYFRTWIDQDIALARSNALNLCNYITVRSIEAVPWLKANFKLYAYQQPLPKNMWEVTLENVQKPIIVPAIVLYWLCFFVFLNTVYCGCHMWGKYGQAIKAWFSRGNLA
jgi:hypothetical protein